MLRRPAGSERRRGAAIVELSIMLPLFIIILIAMWDVGRLIQLAQIVANSAREAGRQASTGKYTNAQVSQVVRTYLEQSGLRITHPQTGTPNVSVTVFNYSRGGEVTLPPSEQNDSLLVHVSYPFVNNRWNVMNRFLPDGAALSYTYMWQNLADIPIDVPSVVPSRPVSWP
ncbi:MAG TPA: pilus assembly protein [Gemmatales bacterium]|nr:pilus assembly protein [Gemmatales bacterium]HMP59964.1 pilus assembly protein [Gemmatales bacterium]